MKMTARLITENYKSNVSQSPSILSTIYNPNVSLACYCNPANWALSNASKQFSKKQSGNSLQLQGAFDDKMIKAVSNFFSGTSHASLIEKHISLMLDMFISLFEPKEIGLRICTN